MARQAAASIYNTFAGGLITEASGLNFPENACTQASNVVFNMIGEVDRRDGFDFEENYVLQSINPAGVAVSTYKWNNVGGDGSTQIIVQQNGKVLYFYLASAATAASPLSAHLLVSTVDMSAFLATNAVSGFDQTVECTFTDGNGYLFVFNGQCDPVYCSFNSGSNTVTAASITIQIRDFLGLPDGLQGSASVATRPLTLSPEHHYNLVNQGWAADITATSTTSVDYSGINVGSSVTFTYDTPPAIAYPLGVSLAFNVNPVGQNPLAINGLTGTVTASSLVSVTVTVTSLTGGATHADWTISFAPGTILQWFSTLANYPSNADQWWLYRDTSLTSPTVTTYNAQTGVGLLGNFNPRLAAQGYIIPNTTQAPQGSMIFPAFIQNRTTASNVQSLTTISTTHRPTNGCFYAGRVWYTGVDDSFQAAGDAPYTTWTETIYFSQIVNTPTDFGACYQQNDPTSSTLFDLLPTDGGTIVIQGSGPIYKLFRIQNGLLVFAANGIWYITGGQAVGFTADNYSVNKISGIQSIGYSSYIDVNGWPVFWNEEGIYNVAPGQDNVPYGQGGFTVNNIALGTILTFYNNIPLQSKKFARGAYNPVTYIIQWIYRSSNETGIGNRYQYDSTLNINTYKGPIYPYTVAAVSPYITSVTYVAGPGGSQSPDPVFKYLTTYNGKTTFSEERDQTTWKDWSTTIPVDYTSTFTSGYKIHGGAIRKFQTNYVLFYLQNQVASQVNVQGVWDYSVNVAPQYGSVTPVQTLLTLGNTNSMDIRKLKLPGRGRVVQFTVTSVSGQPFTMAGWGIYETSEAAP